MRHAELTLVGQCKIFILVQKTKGIHFRDRWYISLALNDISGWNIFFRKGKGILFSLCSKLKKRVFLVVYVLLTRLPFGTG